MSENVFISGADGFIGSNLCLHLACNGFNVLAGVLKKKHSFIQEKLKENTDIVEANILNKAMLEKIIKNVDYCFHFAAQPIISLAESNPSKALELNVKGTVNVFNACSKNNVSFFFFPSTVQVYGNIESLLNKKITEQSIVKPQNTYAETKLQAEQLLERLSKKTQTKALIARTSNVFGMNDLNFSRLVPATIKRLILNEGLQQSYSNAFRDFIFIENVCDFYLKAIKNSNEINESFSVFNLASNKVISIKRMISIIAKNFSFDFKLEESDLLEFNVFSVEKARKLFSWSESFDLNKALKNTVEWYKENWFALKKEVCTNRI